MNKLLAPGLGLCLLLSTLDVDAQNVLGFDTSAIQSNLSFNNGVKAYMGGSLGYARQGSACNQPFFEGDCEDGGTNWKVFGGVRINPMFGAEVGYVQMAEATLDGTIATEQASLTNDLSGFQLTGVAYLPIASVPNLELLGKGGALFWNRDTRKTLGEDTSVSKDNGVSPLLGLGAQYQIDQNLHVRGEWEHAINTGSGSDYETDTDNYTVGLMYSTL